MGKASAQARSHLLRVFAPATWESFVQGKRIVATLIAVVFATAANAAQPPTGVYACYEARYQQGAPGCVQTSIGCFGMAIVIAPVMYFGLVDGRNYLDYDGHGGHYVYDSATGIIAMVDGSLHGVKYKRVGDWSFRKLDDKGKETAFTCPLDPKKKIQHRPW
jgi:hypothetical protein